MLSDSVEGHFKQKEEHCLWETEKSREATSGIFCYRAHIKWTKISAILTFDLTTTKWCNIVCCTLDTTRLISGKFSVSIRISCSVVSASLFSYSTYFCKVTTVSLPTSRPLISAKRFNHSISFFKALCLPFLLQISATPLLIARPACVSSYFIEHHSSCSCRASCMSPISRFPFIICWWFNVETVRVSDGAYPTTHSH